MTCFSSINIRAHPPENMCGGTGFFYCAKNRKVYTSKPMGDCPDFEYEPGSDEEKKNDRT